MGNEREPEQDLVAEAEALREEAAELERRLAEADAHAAQARAEAEEIDEPIVELFEAEHAREVGGSPVSPFDPDEKKRL